MIQTTTNQLQNTYARLLKKVDEQANAFSSNASIADLKAGHNAIRSGLAELDKEIEASTISLSGERKLFSYEYEALQRLARDNGGKESDVLERLDTAEIEGRHVKKIDLSSLDLSSIAALGALSELVEVNLKLNCLKGDPLIPVFLKMKTIKVGSNQLSGISFLASCPNAIFVEIGDNELEGIPKCPPLLKLERFSAPQNKITGLSFLSAFPALAEADLDYNCIDGDPKIPPLSRLHTLWLNNQMGKKISGVSHLASVPGLVAVHLEANALKGDPYFPSLPILAEAFLIGNPLTGVSGLLAQPSLKTVSIDTKKLTPAALKLLGKFTEKGGKVHQWAPGIGRSYNS